MSDEIATLALQLEATQFNSGLERARRQADELGITTGRLTTQTDHLSGSLRSAGAALLSLYAGNKMVGFFKDATQSASTFREDLAQFQHVMRNVRVEADAMVKSLTSDAFGRTELQAMRMTMNMTSMLKGMEMTDKAALKLSGDFAKLAIDIGSFTAKDPNAVFGAFESALMGSTMALRSYGVFLNEAALKSTILENAKKGLVFASEREARAFAILTEAQRQQADAIGDFAVESQGFSNQTKQMVAGLEDLKIKFGNALLEPARQGAVAINTLISTLKGMDDSTFALATRTAVLGTAVVGMVGTYKIVSGVLRSYGALQTIAANTSTTVAANESAETAARNALTAATTANRTAVQLRTASVMTAMSTDEMAAAATAKWTSALEANSVAQTKNAGTRTVAPNGLPASATTKAGKKASQSSESVKVAKTAPKMGVSGLDDKLKKEQADIKKSYAAIESKRKAAIVDIDSSSKKIDKLQGKLDKTNADKALWNEMIFSANGNKKDLKEGQKHYYASKQKAEKLQEQINKENQVLAQSKKRLSGSELALAQANKRQAALESKRKLLDNVNANRAATAQSGFGAFSGGVGQTEASIAAKRETERRLRESLAASAAARRSSGFSVHASRDNTFREFEAAGLNPISRSRSDLINSGFGSAVNPKRSLADRANRIGFNSGFGRGTDSVSRLAGTARGAAAGAGRGFMSGAYGVSRAGMHVASGIASGSRAVAGAVLNPGRTLAAGANLTASLPVRGVGMLGRAFTGLRGGLTPLITSLARGIPLLGRFAPLIGSFLGPVGAIVGIGTGIMAGLKALKEAPMALEWALEKIGNIFSWENLGKAWSGGLNLGAKAFTATKELIGGALTGIFDVGMRGVYGIINATTGSKLQTQSQVLYQQKKKLAEQEEALNAKREAAAKREKEIQEIRMAAAESEEKWLEIQESISAKRVEVAKAGFDAQSKQEWNKMEIGALRPSILAFENNQDALNQKKREAIEKKERAKLAFGEIDEKDSAHTKFSELLGNNQGSISATEKAFDPKKYKKDEADKIKRLIAAKKAEEESEAILTTIENAQKKYSEDMMRMIDLEGEQVALSFENAANMPGLSERVAAYQDIINRSKASLGGSAGNLPSSKELQNRYVEENSEVSRLEQEIQKAETAGKGGAAETIGLREQLTAAQKRAAETQNALALITSHEQTTKKAQEEIDKLVQERNERISKWEGEAFDLKFQNAGRGQQKQMANKAFFDANNAFEGATSWKEKEKAAEELKKAYDRIEKEEGPTWNGVKQGSSGAIESGSVQAREMQSRILNDVNQALLTNAKQQTVIQKAMAKALEEMARLAKEDDGYYVGAND